MICSHVLSRLLVVLVDVVVIDQSISAIGHQSQASVASPKVFKAVGRHFGVPDRVLNVLVLEVVLQGPRVVAIVRELEPTGMAKHVWVDREWHPGGLANALDESVETDGADWPAALGNEYVSVFRVILRAQSMSRSTSRSVR
jgi:hypothetical protein